MAETVAFIGTGNMGAPMAANLLKAGYPLRVWNRTAAKAQPLVEQGAVLAGTPAEAVQGATVVFSILADDAALAEVSFGENGIVNALPAGGVHLSCSTVSPEIGARIAQAHAAKGASYVACPVFGRPDAAAAAKLWICTSGATEAKARARRMLEVLGQGVYDFGQQPEAAHVVKLAGNFVICSAIEAMAEAFTLAQKHGIEREALNAMLSQTLFACPIYQNYGRILTQREFKTQDESPALFTARLMRKDLGLVLDAARAQAVPMPFASVLHDRMSVMVNTGHADRDAPAFTEEIARAAGLPTAL